MAATTQSTGSLAFAAAPEGDERRQLSQPPAQAIDAEPAAEAQPEEAPEPAAAATAAPSAGGGWGAALLSANKAAASAATAAVEAEIDRAKGTPSGSRLCPVIKSAILHTEAHAASPQQCGVTADLQVVASQRRASPHRCSALGGRLVRHSLWSVRPHPPSSRRSHSETARTCSRRRASPSAASLLTPRPRRYVSRAHTVTLTHWVGILWASHLTMPCRQQSQHDQMCHSSSCHVRR